MDYVTTLSEEVWRQRLRMLTAAQDWGLESIESDGARTSGVTFGDKNSLIVLDIYSIRALMKGNLTLAERCITQFRQATTV